MRAVVIEEYGGPEVLSVREVPDPRPAPGEVLVDVVGTSCNRADLLQRMGLYPGPPMNTRFRVWSSLAVWPLSAKASPAGR